jgi:hypothetical protein
MRIHFWYNAMQRTMPIPTSGEETNLHANPNPIGRARV